jgi:hypothetical protein
MSTFRNLSFLFLIFAAIVSQPTSVSAETCYSDSMQVGTTPDVSDDPGNWTCDLYLQQFCDDCCGMCSTTDNAGCDWDGGAQWDPNVNAYFVNDWYMWCNCDLLE